MAKHLPDWRRDPEVVRLQGRVDELRRQAHPIEQEIKRTLLALRDAQTRQAIAEDNMLARKGDATAIMLARQVVGAARAEADEAQAAATGVYAELAEASQQLAEAQAKAQAPVAVELRRLYGEALDQHERALEQAIAADAEVRRVYGAISLQFDRFPGGCMLLAWRWVGLTADNLSVWRKWRADAGFEPIKSKILRLRESAASLLQEA